MGRLRSKRGMRAIPENCRSVKPEGEGLQGEGLPLLPIIDTPGLLFYYGVNDYGKRLR